jgi:flagellar biosynthesis protein FlhF
MRVKTFTADTTAAAMDMVRDSLGSDAVIVSSFQGDDGRAVLVAATEPAEPANEDQGHDAPALGDDGFDLAAFLRQALVSHGVPAPTAARLAEIGAGAEAETAVQALTRALDAQLGFAPLEAFEDGMPPLVLVGPPGAGKTITAAKICARAHMAKQAVVPVTTDVKRAGGVEQLAAFTRILGLELATAPDTDALLALVREHRDGPGRLVIDTAGTNPYDDHDMAQLARIVDTADGEAVLVLPAGGDAVESADMACIYAGATRLIVTRLDIARRLGAVIAAAFAARLPLADVSITHRVGEGLKPITPAVLARLMMPEPDQPNPLATPAEAPETGTGGPDEDRP